MNVSFNAATWGTLRRRDICRRSKSSAARFKPLKRDMVCLEKRICVHVGVGVRRVE